MGRIVKCQYLKCLFGGKVDKDNAVRFNNKNFHEQCLKEYQAILNIRDLCFQIDPTIINRVLYGHLNKLIYDKGIEIDYIIFTLEYILRNKIDVNMPYGLIYRLNDFKIKQIYKASKITSGLKIHSS